VVGCGAGKSGAGIETIGISPERAAGDILADDGGTPRKVRLMQIDGAG
jgi:hypothetical protein